MIPVAIALGSNLGEREGFLCEAIARLSGQLHDLRVSSWHETDPVGVGEQPRFLNGAAVARTELPAGDLLDLLLGIERDCGRTRPAPGSPRTLDLDLILYGNAVIEQPGLLVPHPRFRERMFVLAPLAEVAADWIDPVTGLTVGELLARVRAADAGQR